MAQVSGVLRSVMGTCQLSVSSGKAAELHAAATAPCWSTPPCTAPPPGRGEWDAADWAPRGHGCTNFRGAAYDNDRQVVVGLGGANEADETWEWGGIGWRHRPTRNHPGKRSGTCMTYARARKVSIIYGGSPAYGDTWLYDRVDWTQVSLTGTNPALLNRSLFAQAPIVEDAAPGGFALTNRLQVVVGDRESTIEPGVACPRRIA